jgi:hypothetical protein
LNKVTVIKKTFWEIPLYDQQFGKSRLVEEPDIEELKEDPSGSCPDKDSEAITPSDEVL